MGLLEERISRRSSAARGGRETLETANLRAFVNFSKMDPHVWVVQGMSDLMLKGIHSPAPYR